MSSEISPCDACSRGAASQKRRIVVLGSTGSIGLQTLDVVRHHSDKLEIVGLAAGTRAKELLVQAKEFNVSHIALGMRNCADGSVLDELTEHVETLSRITAGGGSFTQGPDGRTGRR